MTTQPTPDLTSTIAELEAGSPCPVCLKPQGEGCGTVGGVPNKDCPVCRGSGRIGPVVVPEQEKKP